MQQKQTFSAQTLTLSVAAAELGRAIFGAGQTGSVRAVLLGNVLAIAGGMWVASAFYASLYFTVVDCFESPADVSPTNTDPRSQPKRSHKYSLYSTPWYCACG